MGFIFLLFSPLVALAKIPAASLYHYEYWAKSKDQTLTLNNFMNENRPTTFKTCTGSDMNLETAWDLSTGSRAVIVAILDHGFREQHENYKDNIWTNKGESGRDMNGLDRRMNQIDDDTNGFIDDVHGYNFGGNNGDTNQYFWSVDNNQNGALEANWHSTSALGIIGADGEHREGIAGINWKVSMMLLKNSEMNGAGFTDANFASNTARAIHYAVDNGAKVISWSGFIDEKHYLLNDQRRKMVREAFEYAKSKGVLIVIAAGNGHSDLDQNPKSEPFPQQDVDLPNVVYAAETTPCGNLSSFSNFGHRRVKFAAPSENALATEVSSNGYDTYGLAAGTSTATPMVAGVAALVLSVRPELSFAEIEDILCESTRRLAPLEKKIACGGILDAGAALKLAKTYRSSH